MTQTEELRLLIEQILAKLIFPSERERLEAMERKDLQLRGVPSK